MTNFEYITQNITHMVDFLDNYIETEEGTQQIWQENLDESSERWLNKKHKKHE